MAQALELAAGAGALLAAAALLASLLRLSSPLGFVLAAGLLAWTIAVAFILVLSPFGAVRPATTWAWLGAALALAVGAWLAGGRPRPPLAGAGSSARAALRDPAVAVLAALAAVGLAYAGALAVATPENEGDALAYHLARAAFWYQRHGVGWIGHAVDRRLNVTPPNAEIADLFTMLVSGTQRFAGLVQLGAAITLALATAGVARRVGLGPAPAAFGGLVLLTLPVVTTQEWTALNDLVVASFLVTAVYFLLGSGRVEPALGGLATALAVGTKFTALLALPILAGAVLAVRGTKGAARLAWPLVAGVAAGSVWYVLNLAETGKVDGGLASSAGQTPDTVGSILGTLHRFLFDVLDLSGSPSADWRLDHLHGAGGALYRTAGLVLLAVAAALALGRRRGAAALAGAGLLVAAAPALVALAYSLFARAGRPGGATVFHAPNLLANGAASWYGPLGAIGLVAGIAVAAREVRRRAAPRATLALASAPVAFALLLALTIVWDPSRGRFLIFGFALAAASWGLFLRHRWLAWATTAIGAVDDRARARERAGEAVRAARVRGGGGALGVGEAGLVDAVDPPRGRGRPRRARGRRAERPAPRVDRARPVRERLRLAVLRPRPRPPRVPDGAARAGRPARRLARRRARREAARVRGRLARAARDRGGLAGRAARAAGPSFQAALSFVCSNSAVSSLAGRLALAVAAVALLATAPVAAAARVNWNEKAKYAGKPVMSYSVVSITFSRTGWRAVVSFRNLSHKPIQVGNKFGIGFWTNGKSTDFTKAIGLAPVTRFSTKVPAVLRPGDYWSGVISGTGVPNGTGRVFARVIFGPFTGFPGQASSVVWITDHAQPLVAVKVTTPKKGTPKPKPKPTTTTTIAGPVI